MRLQYTPDQDGFIEEPYLFSLSLVYQTCREVIVCQEWHQGIVPTKAKDHFKHSHKEEKIKVNVDHINQIANALNIPKSYPQPWTEGPHPKVAGLAIFTGLKCPNCPRVSISPDKLRQCTALIIPTKQVLCHSHGCPVTSCKSILLQQSCCGGPTLPMLLFYHQ